MKSYKIITLLLYLFTYSMIPAQNSKYIELISPRDNSTLIVSKREGISWINHGVDFLDIEYSLTGKTWTKIYGNIEADIEHVGWKIPHKLENVNIILRIVNSFSDEVYDSSSVAVARNFNTEIQLLKNATSQQKSLKILPLGNSITFDNRLNDGREDEEKIGYRLPLYTMLTNRGIKFDFLGSEHSGSDFLPPGFDENAGFPGISDDQLDTLLLSGILNMPNRGILDTITMGPYLNWYDPDVVLLHIGTNGITQTGSENPDDVENILNHIDSAEIYWQKNMNVILARIIHQTDTFQWVQPFVTSFNDNVEAMAFDRVDDVSNPAYPDLISMVDMENGANFDYTESPDPNGSPGDMNDRWHPNDKGYTKMASVWFDAIIDLLPKLNISLLLEGAYFSADSMNTSGTQIPSSQPFNQLPWNFIGTEFSETIPTNIVDWVLVSLRSDLAATSTVAQRAGFVNSSGEIVDLDGESPLAFVVDDGSYYVVVEHRNHIPIMSNEKVMLSW